MAADGRRGFAGGPSRPSSWRLARAPSRRAFAGDDALLLPKAEIPEERLVDVAIDLFSPGVSDAPASPLL